MLEYSLFGGVRGQLEGAAIGAPRFFEAAEFAKKICASGVVKVIAIEFSCEGVQFVHRCLGSRQMAKRDAAV